MTTRIATLLTLTLTVTACEEQADTPTSEDYDDLAAVVAASLGTPERRSGESSGDLASFDHVVSLAQGEAPLGLSASTEGSWAGEFLGFSYAYDVTCLRFDGTPNDCGPGTTEADVSFTWDADLQTTRYSLVAGQDAAWSVELGRDAAVIAGESVVAGENRFEALSGTRERALSYTWTATYDDVLVDYELLLPVGGTITMALEADRSASSRWRDVDAHFVVSAVVAFESDGTATITLDGDRSYEFDPKTGALD